MKKEVLFAAAPLFQFPISCTVERRMILATALQYVDIFTD
jgi:hypothetical protein